MAARRSAAFERTPPRPDRIRNTNGGFAFLPNRFLHGGFFVSLTHAERSLYLFLVLAGDRNGVSFYRNDRICSALELAPDEFLSVRNSLIAKDLVAFDGTRFQVLSLPSCPVVTPTPPLTTLADFEDNDPATVRELIHQSLGRRRR
jgi:hypothetical protein